MKSWQPAFPSWYTTRSYGAFWCSQTKSWAERAGRCRVRAKESSAADATNTSTSCAGRTPASASTEYCATPLVTGGSGVNQASRTPGSYDGAQA